MTGGLFTSAFWISGREIDDHQYVDMQPGLVELDGQVRCRTDGCEVRRHDVDPQRRVPLEQPGAQRLETVSPARHQNQIDALSGQVPGELRADSAACDGHQRRTVLPLHDYLPAPSSGAVRDTPALRCLEAADRSAPMGTTSTR
jgi:hypothetical protein